MGPVLNICACFFFFSVTKKNFKLLILNDLSLTVLGLIIASQTTSGVEKMKWFGITLKNLHVQERDFFDPSKGHVEPSFLMNNMTRWGVDFS